MKSNWLKLVAVIVILLAVIVGYRHEKNVANYNRTRVTAVSSVRHRSPNKIQGQPKNLTKHYRILLSNSKTQRVTSLENIYRNPNHTKQTQIGNTKTLLQNPKNFTNLVQVDQKAVAKNKPTFDHIMRQGKPIGWVNANAVHSISTYVLPYVYISQFWPSAAEDACEEASLKTAMSTQNKAMNVPLQQIVKQTPRSKNPNVGYTKNPYKYGSHATIYPDAMVRIARKYGAQAKDISGATKSQFIQEVTHGHAVVFEGPYMLKKPGSDHDLVILGYRKGQFFVADPFARHHKSPKTRWASTSLLMRLYNKKFRHQRALVVE